jgi:anti-sigma factor RsiW
MTCPSAEGNRNALLALHFGECDARTGAEVRAHVESCPACGQYLATLSELDELLAKWHDDAPPAGMGEGIVARAVRSPQPPPRMVRPRAGALPLLGLLPVMGALVALIRLVAAWLPVLSFWPPLEQWPALQPVVPFVAATLTLLVLGGLATLAAAPALVLEARRLET